MLSTNDVTVFGSDDPPGIAPLLEIDVERRGQRATVHLRGELDYSTVSGLRDELVQLNEEGFHEILLELSGLAFVDSTGLGIFVNEHKRARRSNIEFVLLTPSENLERLLTVSGLTEVLTIR
jgi:anti-sigma B factor antagonist